MVYLIPPITHPTLGLTALVGRHPRVYTPVIKEKACVVWLHLLGLVLPPGTGLGRSRVHREVMDTVGALLRAQQT